MTTDKMIIPKAVPAGGKFFKKGVYAVMIKSVDWARTASKGIRENSKGNRGFDFTFVDQAKNELKDTYWLGKAQFRLDAMLKEFGIDNSKSDFDATKTIGAKAWAIVAEEFQLEDGVQMMSKDGKYKVSYPRIQDFIKIVKGMPAPVVDPATLVITKETKSGAVAPAVASANDMSLQEEAPSFEEASPNLEGDEGWGDDLKF